MPLAIRPTGLHWLPGQPDNLDLCAHGGVEVVLPSGVVTAAQDLAVSTGALHLLRALARDHIPEAPLAEHLIPHCGHWMVLAPGTTEPENVGCPSGLNWWVRHENGTVSLQFDQNLIRVSSEEWRRAVARYSTDVLAFFEASAPKTPPEDDLAWYSAFRHEWRYRQDGALAAV